MYIYIYIHTSLSRLEIPMSSAHGNPGIANKPLGSRALDWDGRCRPFLRLEQTTPQQSARLTEEGREAMCKEKQPGTPKKHT